MKRLALPKLDADLLLILLIVSLCFNVLLGYLSQAERIRVEPSVVGTYQILPGPSTSMCLVLTGDQTYTRYYPGELLETGRYRLDDMDNGEIYSMDPDAGAEGKSRFIFLGEHIFLVMADGEILKFTKTTDVCYYNNVPDNVPNNVPDSVPAV